MNILVTGAGGFVGMRLVQGLLKEGHNVFAVVRPEFKQIDTAFKHQAVTLIKTDLAQLDVKILPTKINALITLAQSRHFREFPDKADDIFQVNVAANAKLWAWAQTSGVSKIIHVSSGGIYGQSTKNNILDEDNPIPMNSPIGFYLGTKLCSEVVLNNYKDFFESCIIVRPFFIYGPGQKKDMLIARLIDTISKDKTVTLHGQNGLRLNPVYIDDAVTGLINALDLSGYHVINMAGPKILHLKQIAERIAKKLGKKVRFEITDNPAPDYATSTEKSRTLLGIPSTSFDDGIEKTMDHTSQ